MNEFLKYIKESILRALALIGKISGGKATQRDIAKVVISIVIITAAIILLMSIRLWFAPIVAIAVIIWGFTPVKPAPTPIIPVNYIIYQCLFRVVCEIYDRIDVHRPIDIEDIVSAPSIIQKNGICMVRVRLAPKQPSFDVRVDLEQMDMIKKILQSRINTLLRAGKVDYVPSPSIDNIIPIMYVDEVNDIGTEYLVDIVYADNMNAVKYIHSKVANKLSTAKTVEPTDTDF